MYDFEQRQQWNYFNSENTVVVAFMKHKMKMVCYVQVQIVNTISCDLSNFTYSTYCICTV